MLRLKIRTIEIGVAALLIALGALLIFESLRLGAGWTFSGPQAGFFPFVVSAMAILGAIGVLYFALTKPNNEPFFEVSQEIADLLKTGLPIVVSVFALRWLGLFVVAGLYLGFSMLAFGRFRWWQAMVGLIAMPAILWFTLRYAFNIAMPTSMFYRSGLLPF